MPTKTKKAKGPRRNPSDPNLLARAVIEAAIGESLNAEKPPKRKGLKKR